MIYGIIVIVVTNQSGIARGFYSEEEFKSFTNEINESLRIMELILMQLIFAPSSSLRERGFKRDCNCRKPKSGMLEKGNNEWHSIKEIVF